MHWFVFVRSTIPRRSTFIKHIKDVQTYSWFTRIYMGLKNPGFQRLIKFPPSCFPVVIQTGREWRLFWAHPNSKTKCSWFCFCLVQQIKILEFPHVDILYMYASKNVFKNELGCVLVFLNISAINKGSLVDSWKVPKMFENDWIPSPNLN